MIGARHAARTRHVMLPVIQCKLRDITAHNNGGETVGWQSSYQSQYLKVDPAQQRFQVNRRAMDALIPQGKVSIFL